jgi:hypothetical protein
VPVSGLAVGAAATYSGQVPGWMSEAAPNKRPKMAAPQTGSALVKQCIIKLTGGAMMSGASASAPLSSHPLFPPTRATPLN